MSDERDQAAASMREALEDLVADRRPCLAVPNGYHDGEDCPDTTAAVAADEPDGTHLLEPPATQGRLAVHGRTLDWASQHDERSRAYALADRLRHRVALQNHVWPTGPAMNQGSEGACVGFAAAAAHNVLEMRDGANEPWEMLQESLVTADDALHLYGRAQELDELAGEDYAGTSVLAGMKAGVEAGWWDGYGGCFGTRDLAQAVLQVGPVIVGVPWTTGLYETKTNGRMKVTGKTVGGHCIAVVGLAMELEYPTLEDPAGPYFVVQNSWGAGYGIGGLGYLHHLEMARLLSQHGEAAIPLRDGGWEPAP